MPTGTTFLQRQFGALADDVAQGLIEAGSAAHGRSLDARAASRLRTNHAYGSTFWLALPEEVRARLLRLLPDALTFHPTGSQYDLLMWNGKVILPVSALEGSPRSGSVRARWSPLRQRLMSVNATKPPEPTLFDEPNDLVLGDGSGGLASDVQSQVSLALSATFDERTTAVIVAAYLCTPTAGVQGVVVGLGNLLADGSIAFTDSERVGLTASPTPTLDGATSQENFSQAPRPRPALSLAYEAPAASGDADPSARATVTQPARGEQDNNRPGAVTP